MLLSDLIAQMQARNPTLPARLVDDAVRQVFREIESALAAGGRIELRGFGVLEVRERGGGRRRNPKTGEPIEIGDRRHVHWRTGKPLAAALNPDG